jgi:bifunctional DNA-binding transcriptional regulator/antitoxin component of YhaV-PrlF toxin-antitoxin module
MFFTVRMVSKDEEFEHHQQQGPSDRPQEIRNRIGLAAGDRVEFVVENGKTTIRPLRSETNPFEKYKGILKSFRSRKEINGWISEMRDEEKHRAWGQRWIRTFYPRCGPASHPRGIESILFDARSQGGLVICTPVYGDLLAYPSATQLMTLGASRYRPDFTRLRIVRS